MSRSLLPVSVPSGPRLVDVLLPALAAAIDGTGPAVLPLPAGPDAADVVSAMHPEQPVEDEAALVVATSGSTGVPKGVVIGRSALVASARATAARLGGDAQWLLAMPPRFVGGVQVLVRSVLSGTTPVVLDLSEGFRAEDFVPATARLTGPRRHVSLVPTQVRRLLDAGGDAVDALRSYDAILLGGAAAPAGLLAEARAAGVRLVVTYGMSETAGGCVYDGVPLDGVAVDTTEDGRIRLAGPVLALGYRLQPELTAACFRDGWFETSDLGTVGADGRLVVLGRVDDVIVTGGEKVAALAVEDALAAHPAVSECAVVGVPDREWGARVQAYVVAAGEAPTARTLQDHVAARLPRAAVPRDVVYLSELPRLAGGKVDRRALVDRGGTP